MLKYLAICLLLSSCVSDLVSRTVSKDERPISIQFFSLFSQHDKPVGLETSWKGDWLLRRERLDLIDKVLFKDKPDLLLLHDVLMRKGNPYDSDRGILKAGALSGYSWYDVGLKFHEDTNEIESLAVVSSVPVRIDTRERATKFWTWGSSTLTSHIVYVYDKPVLIFQFKPHKNDELLYDDQLLNTILTRIEESGVCAARVLFAAYAPSASRKKLKALRAKMQWLDVSKGFCNVEKDCYTSSANNQLNLLAYGNALPAREDVMFVSPETKINHSSRNFVAPGLPPTSHFKVYGLRTLWPSHRYGWRVKLQFASCPDIKL